MFRKIAVGVVLSVFSGVHPLVVAAGVVYDAELTNGVWTAGVAALSTAGGPAVSLSGVTGWTVSAEVDAIATNQTVVFDADAASPLIYTPASHSGAVALVNVSLVVEPNASIPSTEGLGSAQAALSAVTNATSGGLDWIGLVRDGATNKWLALEGDHPVCGGEYDVQIALDNRDGQKKIRYAVKPSSSASYAVLASGGVAWLENPKSDLTHVSSVAFAGCGTVGELSGGTLVDDGASITSIADARGYDFTNGTVTAVFGISSGVYSGKTAVLRVVNFADGTATEYVKDITGANPLSWDLSGLTPGGIYSYTLSVKSGADVRAVKTGTFEAANMDSDCWFCAKVVDSVAVLTNGTWATEPELASDRWNVSSDALFAVSDLTKGSNAVSRVDTIYSFGSPIDRDSLDSLGTDVIGGIVAVSDDGGAWCAFTSDGWTLLAGGVVPETNTEYIVRAEFDFLSTPKRVRYSVARYGGSDFMPLTLGGAEWISLAIQTTGALQSVGMSGNGSVKSICANVADKAVILDTATGIRYSTIWEAVKNGVGPFSLLTNATLKPTGDLGKTEFKINESQFNMLIDKSDLGKWRLFQKDGVWFLMKPGATYMFF